MIPMAESGQITVRIPVEERGTLCDALDRLLDTGVVATGDLVIKVADIDLVYVNLQLVACSWETARKTMGATASPGSPGEEDP
jgi:hypothetical protein